MFKAGYGFTAGWAGQHTGSIYGMFMGIPGLKVVLPSTPADAKGLMATAIRDDNPVCYLMHYLLVLEHGDVPEGEYLVPFGEAAIRREGGDVTIVATGWTVGRALAAAETLAGEGIQAEVIDPRTLAPLDTATILSSVEKTGRLVIADQGTRHGGASPVIAAEVAEHGFSSLKAPIAHVTAHDVTVPYSEPMEAFVLPNEEKIAGSGAPGAGRSARRRLAARPWQRNSTPRRRRTCCATMWRIRCFEERVASLKRSLQVHGLIHLSIGGEGVAAAVCGQLRDDDGVYSGHRAHGHAIAKGAPLDRADGGADGPRRRHLRAGSADRCTWSTSSTDSWARPGWSAATCRSRWATRWPPGCAAPIRSRWCSSATARSRPGTSHESVNLAALWELSLVFVCENNGFAEFTPRSAHTVDRAGVATWSRRTGSSARTVDGGDVPAVYEAFGEFLAAARAGPWPDAARVPDPPPPRPLRGRPAELPRPGRRGRVGATRPDCAAARRGAPAGLARRATRSASSSAPRAPRSTRRSSSRAPARSRSRRRPAGSCTRASDRRRDDIPGGGQRRARAARCAPTSG